MFSLLQPLVTLCLYAVCHILLGTHGKELLTSQGFDISKLSLEGFDYTKINTIAGN